MGKFMYSDREGSAPAGEELRAREMKDAELGFRRLLRARRFSRTFRERHVADLLAQARLEYARHIARGERIDNPTGWIIHCAWRRTQNLLERESRSPAPVPLRRKHDLSQATPTPEEEVLETDRHRRLRVAIERLAVEERQVLALTYFEGMSVREASRTLKWDKCKGDRRHRAALEHLREAIGVDHIDEFEIDIGICAWASLEVAHRSGLLTSVAEPVGRVVLAGLGRAQEIARRLLTGGAADPGLGVAAGTATRTAGACGAVVLACLASGVVGPGLGGVDVVGHRPAQPAIVDDHGSERAHPQQVGPLAEPVQRISSSTDAGGRPAKKSSAGKTGSAAHTIVSRQASTRQTSTSATPSQVEEEFDPFSGGESQSTEATTAEEGTPSRESPTPSRSNGPVQGSGSAPPASGKQVESEFGL